MKNKHVEANSKKTGGDKLDIKDDISVASGNIKCKKYIILKKTSTHSMKLIIVTRETIPSQTSDVG